MMKTTERICNGVDDFAVRLAGTLALPALAFAVAVGPFAAQAEWWAFKGSASAPSYWDAQANWHISGSTWANFETSTCNNFHINPKPSSSNIFTAGWDSNITFRANSPLTSRILLRAGSSSNPIRFIAENGDASYGITSSGELYISCNANSPDASLEIQSGTYTFGAITVGGDAVNNASSLTIAGGTVKHSSNYLRVGWQSSGVVTIKEGGVYDNTGGNGNLTVGYNNSEGGATRFFCIGHAAMLTTCRRCRSR